MPAASRSLKELFLAALAVPAADRVAWLDRECGGDAEVRRRVEAMLAAHDAPQSLLDPLAPPEGPPAGRTATVADGVGSRPGTDTAHEPPGTVLAGRYTLLERIGEGGMGTVWLARQTDPVQRLVAVKVIKAGLDSRQVVARFEQERQALALMDHANIAKVLDGGLHEQRPYFVMELVEGVPITRYCDDHRLTVRQRLELFVPVCQAVQHAHTKGVIHRDIKPSNVLVARYDGKPVPKVIDFGVAKAAGQPLTDKTLETGFGALVGTLEYMSPEQATLNQIDIDTRSDVYSLGVLLYELLTGTTPFRRKEVEAGGLLELLRTIREQEPTKPSRRLRKDEGGRMKDEQRRSGSSFILPPSSFHELDWIVMRALEKDRGRRYDTATAFAQDVQRYLADEPVLACPPAAAYRLRKFVRRHRREAVAAGLVLLTLVGGVIGTSVGMVRAVRARETAERRFDQVKQGIDALSSIFNDLDPQAEEKEGKPLRAILADRLDGPAAALDGEAVGDPLLVAELQNRLGQAYLGLGQPAKAEAQFARALATCRGRLGEGHPTTLDRMHDLATAYKDAGRTNEAIALFERVRDAKVQAHGADDPNTLLTLHGLGVAYGGGGRVPEAVAVLEGVRDAYVKRYGADDPRTLSILNNLAVAYISGQRAAEGIALHEQVLAAFVKRHGEGHTLSIAAMNNLAIAYQGTFRRNRALVMFQRARDAAVLALGPLHPETLGILGNLAFMYRTNGNLPEAIALGEQVVERQSMTLGANHPKTLTVMDSLALAYRDSGRLDKALPLFQQAAASVERLRFSHKASGRIILNLCDCQERLNQFAEAEAWQRKWLGVLKTRGEPRTHEYREALQGLTANLLQQNKHAAAEPLLRECLALQQEKEPEAWNTSLTRARLGAALVGQKKYRDAEQPLVQGYEGMSGWAERLGRSHAAFTRKPLTDALEGLVRLYNGWGKPAEAARWRKLLDAHTKGTD